MWGRKKKQLQKFVGGVGDIIDLEVAYKEQKLTTLDDLISAHNELISAHNELDGVLVDAFENFGNIFQSMGEAAEALNNALNELRMIIAFLILIIFVLSLMVGLYATICVALLLILMGVALFKWHYTPNVQNMGV